MLALVVEFAVPVLNEWAIKIEDSGQSSAEIEIDGDLNNITSQTISRILFGSSYEKGFSVIDKLYQLQKTFFATILAGIPGIRFVLVNYFCTIFCLARITYFSMFCASQIFTHS